MLVSELRETYGDQQEEFRTVRLRDISLTGLGLEIGSRTLDWDDITSQYLAKFLDVNPSYLKKCPAELQQANINFWLDHDADADAVFHFVGRSLRGIASPTQKMIPVTRVLDIVNRVFVGGDEIKTFSMDEKLLHLDIISSSTSIEVPGLGTQERPHVGDITHGGIRLLIHLQEQKAPEIETYFNRLICTNGASAPKVENRLTLTGNTVEDILFELENKANILMNDLPLRLEEYKATAEVSVPGDVAQFAYQLGREHALPQRIMDRVMLNLADLPESPSIYDVTQIFTSVANEDVTFGNMLRLQRIGGQLSTDTEATLHRCGTCERLF